MSDIALRVRNLGKRYRIGVREQGYQTFREALVGAVAAPVRNLGRLRSLTKFANENGDSPADDTIWALEDVSFDVKEGEVVGIIGANGAGKSTLLKILAHITEPTTGFVQIKGRVSSLLEVGTGFHPELTGRENVYLNAAVLGMRKKEIDRKFDEIVDFSGVEKFIDTPVKRYSSGMQVRLAFSVAAHLEPEILIIDEVLAVGDAAFQKKCLGKMGEVAKEGRTVLFVSHNMVALQNLCNISVWLDHGRARKKGESRQVISEYLKTTTDISAAERIWNDISTAPGTQEVRIKSVSVRSESHEPGAMLLADREIGIRVDFWSLIANQDLTITLHLISEDGSIAFSTSTAHNNLSLTRFNKGLFQAHCKIPANLLNNHVYRVRLLVVKDGANVVFAMDDALGFEVLEPGDRRGTGYFGKRPGILAPMLDWEVLPL